MGYIGVCAAPKGMVFSVWVINRVGNIPDFGHKQGEGFKKRAAHPHRAPRDVESVDFTEKPLLYSRVKREQAFCKNKVRRKR